MMQVEEIARDICRSCPTSELVWLGRRRRCLFAIPRSELTKSRIFNPSLMTNGGNGAVVDLNRKDKPRVLLVEDEALVAMMIQDTLAEFGFQVVGPLSTASEALSAAREPL
jgi:chemotaxis family two-component system sensor kinase Cph1